jgi:hypothetical protein
METKFSFHLYEYELYTADATRNYIISGDLVFAS